MILYCSLILLFWIENDQKKSKKIKKLAGIEVSFTSDVTFPVSKALITVLFTFANEFATFHAIKCLY
jgi:hypothetical protein